jgi:hypothetical protein
MYNYNLQDIIYLFLFRKRVRDDFDFEKEFEMISKKSSR